MGTIYRKTVTRPLPPGCKIITRKGKQFAQWMNRKGKTVTAELSESGNRIRTETGTYLAKYRDGDGLVCEVSTGCTDKVAAQSVLNELIRTAQYVKSKIITSDQAKIADHADTLLSEHMDAYIEHLKSRNVHPDRIKTTKRRLNESACAIGWRYLRDLNADKLQIWLSGQAADREREMSATVHNGYVQLWVSFGHWLTGKRIVGKRSNMNGDKRLIVNPFDGMGKLDERADPRRKARALTETELVNLLNAARRRPKEDVLLIRKGPRKGEQCAKVSSERLAKLERIGHERALIYKTAILTGLRLNELRTLTVNCLSFGDVPFVRLSSSNEKNRKGSTLALRSDLAADLREWIAGKEPTDSVFNVPCGLLRILDRDLKTAGIPKRDADGCVVHVHALRHSFGTHLSMAGVAPRVAQAAMRHSNISLTMNTYTDARLLDTAAAVESLPNLPLSRTVAPTVAPTADDCGQNESIPDQNDGCQDSAEERKNPAISLGNAGFLSIGAAGFEPTTSTTPR
jgi:integrase